MSRQVVEESREPPWSVLSDNFTRASGGFLASTTQALGMRQALSVIDMLQEHVKDPPPDVVAVVTVRRLRTLNVNIEPAREH